MDSKLALSTIMQEAPQSIIHGQQTGVLKGRHLVENITKILEVINERDTKERIQFRFVLTF